MNTSDASQPASQANHAALVEQLQLQLSKTEVEAATLRRELQKTQMQLIAAEKMAALGHLLTNVGHEINTPVSAMKSSAQSIERLLPLFVQELPALLQSLNAEQSRLFHHLLQVAANNETSLTTKEERQHRKEMEEWLASAGIADAGEMAKQLVEMQLVHVKDYLPLFRHDEADLILQVLKHLAQVRTSVLNLNLAAEKTTKIILALKSYSHVSSPDKLEAVNLEQNIQSILTIYHNLLKHGVQVVKNFGTVPTVPGYPDQLGQVWANLIHNAIQAMRGSGTLTIGVQRVEAEVHVVIGDTGSGIAPENINRVFEPFFTTKDQNEGSGLGLDIVRRIVERHGGKIYVTSKPGDTQFHVHLPVELKQAPVVAVGAPA